MTKIKLTDGAVLSCSEVKLENGTLKIVTSDRTVEELAELFSDKQKTSDITLMTESEMVTGNKVGFTSFEGITYNPDGTKTVELFQPADVTESRISNAEGAAHAAGVKLEKVEANMQANLEAVVTELTLAMAMSSADPETLGRDSGRDTRNGGRE